MFDETHGPYYFYIGGKVPTARPWRVTWVGQDIDQVEYAFEDAILTDYPETELISAPPRIGMGDYLTYEAGTGVRWRRAPARKPRWDREGIHALLGLFTGLFPLAALLFAGGDWWLGAALLFVVTWIFVQYENTEGSVIADYQYRDFGGYIIGLMVASVATILAAAFLA